MCGLGLGGCCRNRWGPGDRDPIFGLFQALGGTGEGIGGLFLHRDQMQAWEGAVNREKQMTDITVALKCKRPERAPADWAPALEMTAGPSRIRCTGQPVLLAPSYLFMQTKHALKVFLF